jgi:hypothetical protein
MTPRIGIVCLAFAVGACESGVDAPPPDGAAAALPVDVVHRGSRCPASRAQVDVIGDAEAWADWQRRSRESFLPAGDAQAPDAPVDFAESLVVVVSMGERPTAGYAVDVSGDAVRLRGGGVLEIDADWREPPEDAVVAQVLTSPCVAIAVSRVEFERVRILDRNGDVVIDRAF